MKKQSYSSFVSPSVKSKANVFEKVNDSQVVNNCGAFVYKINEWDQVDRFLIIGSASPTYYSSRKELVKDNTSVMQSCIKADGKKFVNRIVEISESGRAPSNDPALFALALAISYGSDETRELAYNSLSKVARIGTHLFHFVDYINDLFKWRKGLKRAVSDWFNKKKPDSLVYQILKYRQRDGWSMKDVIRLSHPKAASDTHNSIYHYITKGWESIGKDPHPDPALVKIWAFEKAKASNSEKEIAKLVRDYKLSWEMIDTKWLNSIAVWDELIKNIKPEALIRNLARLSANGFIKDFSPNVNLIVNKITDAESLKESRLHPFKILIALNTYKKGYGDKGSLRWTPNQKIVDALDDAFYLAHKYVEPTNKRIMLALDVSGSMSSQDCGSLPLSPREASAAIAMSIAKTEKNCYFYGFSDKFIKLDISEKMRLPEVIKKISDLPFSYTDCSLPFQYALDKNIELDAIVILTDNETNSGKHPSEVLKSYRRKFGLNTRLIVVGMTSTGFSIADSSDRYSLDIVGLDSSVPELVSNFIGERFTSVK